MATATAGESESSHILFPSEAELYAQNLRTFQLEEVGTSKWTKQHEAVEKLNMQAVLNASQQGDEFVKEFLVTFGKVPVLIHSLILTELWKENVFPVLLKRVKNPKTTFPCYIVLYHEATLVNLLETTLFFEETTESAEDSALDLVDYCHRKIVRLMAGEQSPEDSDSSDGESAGSLKELKQQNREMEFQISMRCISIVRYLVDHMECLPLSVATRILNKHDLPCLFTSLLESPPWVRRNDKDGSTEKFIEGKWKGVPASERFQLTKTEAQVWLGVYQMMLKPFAQQKYEFNPVNKNHLLKLRAHLMEPYIDQIPNLADLRRYLEHLAMMDPPPPRPSLVLEQVPEVYDGLVSRYRGKWEEVASAQLKRLFKPSDSELKEQAKRWVDTYNFDVLDNLISEPPKCALCGQPATKRCSRCKIEWYCGRECQVSHWSKHKQACDTVASSLPVSSPPVS